VSGAFFIVALIFAMAVMALVIWTVRPSKGSGRRARKSLELLESAPRHLCNMTSIRQALDRNDVEYAREKGGAQLAKRLRGDRRKVAFLYLAAIRSDFEGLLNLARVAALLSPEISSLQEYDRLRLTVIFRARFQLVRLRLLLGNAAMPQFGALGQMVTSLAVQMETAMAELGERAARAAELAVQSDR
jgi:hypothetical protein